MDSQDMHIIGYIISFIAGIIVMRSVFSIGIFLRHTKSQTKILLLIAKKLDCDNSKVGDIEKEVNEQTFLERINS